MGNLLAVTVHAANIHDTVGGVTVYNKSIERIHLLGEFPATWVIAEPLLLMLPKQAENVT